MPRSGLFLLIKYILKKREGVWIFMLNDVIDFTGYKNLCLLLKEGGMENHSFFKEVIWNANLSSGRLTVSLSYGRPEQAPMSYISGVILLHK